MIQDKVAEIADALSFFDTAEDAYDYIIDLGRRHEGLNEGDRIDAHRVQGCQSQVWLTHRPGPGGTHLFAADSDAFIVRGLVALILSVYSGRTAEEILQISDADILEKIDLRQFITPGRQNGVRAIVRRIQDHARPGGA